MSAALEAVLAQIAELTNTIKENGGSQGLNVDLLTTKFEQLLSDHKAALLDAIPARPGEFSTPPVFRAVEGYHGKYAREIRDIAARGADRHRGPPCPTSGDGLAQLVPAHVGERRPQARTGPAGARAPGRAPGDPGALALRKPGRPRSC